MSGAVTDVVADEQAPLPPGTELLPGYSVLRHLRRGRPFDVYEVFCERRRCSCVAKTARPAASGNAQVEAALLEEGKRLAALSHPHLVQVYEVVDAPTPGVILETLGGETLKFMIHNRGRPIDPTGLVHLGLQLCSALSYLHRNDLLHLDLKPSNVINDRGRAKVIDLSVARTPGPGPCCGTSVYLSPEQAIAGDVTAASDVWGVGALLYEAITSEVPFPGSVTGDYEQLRERRTIPTDHRGRVASGMSALIDACLDPAAMHRPSLADVEALLESIA